MPAGDGVRRTVRYRITEKWGKFFAEKKAFFCWWWIFEGSLVSRSIQSRFSGENSIFEAENIIDKYIEGKRKTNVVKEFCDETSDYTELPY